MLWLRDGVEFNRASIEVGRIKEDADYEGVRVGAKRGPGTLNLYRDVWRSERS